MKDNGGPAFPHTLGDLDPPNTSGMTLRDWFAGQALTGLLTKQVWEQSGPDMFARDAYAIADAMLKERENEP